MKNIFRNGSLASLLAAAMIFAACTKENSDVKIPATKLTTSETIDITSNSATVVGFIATTGSGISEKGACYSTTPNPTVNDNKVVYSVDTVTATYNVKITGLTFATKYYARAYAVTKDSTIYGAEITFTTLPLLPVVTTASVSEVSGTSATSGGDVTYDGGGTISQRGVCFSELPNPTVQNKDSITKDGKGLGAFISKIAKLSNNKTYHVRAYAINEGGVGYGEDIEFKTIPTALYMVGDGVSDWTWNIDLPMVPVNSHQNLFWKIVWMNATGGFKINSAKAWDGNEFGKTGDAVGSVSDANGAVYDKGGDNIPVPGTAGYYMVVVDYATGKIAIADPKVYLIGDVIGSWDTANPNGLFTVDNANSVITINKTLASAEIRMYAWHPWFDQWWQSEFIVLGGQIEFRGTGGDQTRVTVPAGTNQVDLNFITGVGSITQP